MRFRKLCAETILIALTTQYGSDSCNLILMQDMLSASVWFYITKSVFN